MDGCCQEQTFAVVDLSDRAWSGAAFCRAASALSAYRELSLTPDSPDRPKRGRSLPHASLMNERQVLESRFGRSNGSFVGAIRLPCVTTPVAAKCA